MGTSVYRRNGWYDPKSSWKRYLIYMHLSPKRSWKRVVGAKEMAERW